MLEFPTIVQSSTNRQNNGFWASQDRISNVDKTTAFASLHI